MNRLGLLLFAMMLLSGLLYSSDKKTQTQPEVVVNYQVIQQGTYSGMKDPLAKVLTTESEWEELWKKHVSVIVPQPLLPKIDMTANVIVVIFSGEKKTSGYRIVVKSIKSDGTNITITYHETQPPENSLTLQVLSQPFLMMQLPKPVSGTVNLVKE
jgi:PrcB C-terminal